MWCPGSGVVLDCIDASFLSFKMADETKVYNCVDLQNMKPMQSYTVEAPMGGLFSLNP